MTEYGWDAEVDEADSDEWGYEHYYDRRGQANGWEQHLWRLLGEMEDDEALEEYLDKAQFYSIRVRRRW